MKKLTHIFIAVICFFGTALYASLATSPRDKCQGIYYGKMNKANIKAYQCTSAENRPYMNVSRNGKRILTVQGTGEFESSELKQNLALFRVNASNQADCNSHFVFVDLNNTIPKAFEFGLIQQCATLKSFKLDKNAGYINTNATQFKYDNGRLWAVSNERSKQGQTQTAAKAEKPFVNDLRIR